MLRKHEQRRADGGGEDEEKEDEGEEKEGNGDYSREGVCFGLHYSSPLADSSLPNLCDSAASTAFVCEWEDLS